MSHTSSTQLHWETEEIPPMADSAYDGRSSESSMLAGSNGGGCCC